MVFDQLYVGYLLHQRERVGAVPVPTYTYLFYVPLTKQEHVFLVVLGASEHPCVSDGLPPAVGVVAGIPPAQPEPSRRVAHSIHQVDIQ